MNDQIRDCLWVSIFPLLLISLCEGLLPHGILLQLSITPLWVVWFLLTRGPKKGLWITLWCGLLLEARWILPPGTCVLFFLACWALIHSIQEVLPDRFHSGFGLTCGTLLVPLLYLWCWFYTMLSFGFEAAYELLPTFGQLILSPTFGAIGGALVFHVAAKCEFRALKPKRERNTIHANGN